jgi:putative phage-type endonuclease
MSARPAYRVIHEDTTKIERPAWLADRKTGIGSSDAAAAAHQSPWRSDFELWAEKRGLISDADDNWRFRIGREAEPLVLSWWAEIFDVEHSALRRHTMVRSLEHPFMLGNADADSDQLDAVIEVKTSSEFDQKRWDEGVPDQYVIQGVHLALVYGRPRTLFPVAFGWNPPVQFEVRLDDLESATLDALVTTEADLWRRVQENDPPDPDGSESAMMAIREMYLADPEQKSVELPDSAIALIKAREAEIAIAAAATKRADAAKQTLLKMLVDEGAEVGTYLGDRLFTYLADKNGKRSMRFT